MIIIVLIGVLLIGLLKCIYDIGYYHGYIKSCNDTLDDIKH